MMRMRTKSPAFVPVSAAKSAAFGNGEQEPKELEWEVRPCGMLVQKRNPDTDVAAGPPPPTIRVRVKYGAAQHEIHLSSQASFGELKKLLSTQTGLHPQDQKLLFKDKERDSNAFLDISGVKDRSKIVLVEDPAGQARRCLEMRKNAKMEKAAKSISQISLEVDKLSSQVSALESIVSKGKKVAENDVLGLIEQLMNQLIKLDGIVADGDVKIQRRLQVRRVQKYVETLDVLKLKNAVISNSQPPLKLQQQNQYQKKPSQPLVEMTSKWETFDLLSALPSTSAATSTTTSTATTATTAATAVSRRTGSSTTSITTTTNPTPRFDWELF